MNLTPCVGRCTTIYGDDVCRGCFRHEVEVRRWNRLSDDQRTVIRNRLARTASHWDAVNELHKEQWQRHVEKLKREFKL